MVKGRVLLFWLLLAGAGAQAETASLSPDIGESEASLSSTAPVSREKRPESPDNEDPDLNKKNYLKTPSAGPAVAPGTRVSEVSNWPVVVLGLLGIVMLILLVAWLLKRLGGLHAMGMRGMKVVAVLPLGAREKVALVDINGQQLLLGVTSQNINLLHTFDQPVLTETDKKGGHDFASKLQSLLARQTSNENHD